MNLKCDPAEALFLRDMFDAVVPGYHMNKTHWNTVILDGSIPRGEIERMIDRSYGLVVKKLKRAERVALEVRFGAERCIASAPPASSVAAPRNESCDLEFGVGHEDLVRLRP